MHEKDDRSIRITLLQVVNPQSSPLAVSDLVVMRREVETGEGGEAFVRGAQCLHGSPILSPRQTGLT